jgi:hypothetical protein
MFATNLAQSCLLADARGPNHQFPQARAAVGAVDQSVNLFGFDFGQCGHASAA